MNLVEKVGNIINEANDAVCVSYFSIEIDDDSYTLKLDLNQDMAPLTISYQGSEDDFCKFLKKELSSRQIARTRYYSGEMTDAGQNELIYININGSRGGN